eukprot:PhF_6_TR16810/c0_g1_i1/m.25379
MCRSRNAVALLSQVQVQLSKLSHIVQDREKLVSVEAKIAKIQKAYEIIVGTEERLHLRANNLLQSVDSRLRVLEQRRFEGRIPPLSQSENTTILVHGIPRQAALGSFLELFRLV